MDSTLRGLSTLLFVLLSAGLASAQTPAAPKTGDDDGNRLLRRAAYYETQKRDADKALATYEEVVRDFPDSRAALKAMERIAVLDEQAGRLDDAKQEHELAAALRAKIGAPEPETSKEPRRRGALRQRIRKLLGKEHDEKPLTEAPKEARPAPSELGEKIEEWRKEGLSKEEIRERVRAELKALVKKQKLETKREAKAERKDERKETRRAAIRRKLLERRHHHEHDTPPTKGDPPAPREV
jgi:tetratricopeptide (TPR) repeat protein